MSWFNSGLNTLKGQLSTFAQEVLAESEGSENVVNPFEALEECKKQNEELIIQCSTKDTEIASLRKQIAQLEKNASLEGSWICETDNLPSDSSGKNDNERNSESSSGGEMITIPLETNLPSESGSWEKIHKSAEEKDQKLKKLLQENSSLKEKIIQLTTDNQELTENLETLDSQHNIAIQEILEVKNEVQSKLASFTAEHDVLKEQHQRITAEHQQDLENLKEKLENRYEKEIEALHTTVKKFEEQSVNLKKACEAKDENIMQLLEKIQEYESNLKRKEAGTNDQVAGLTSEIDILKEQLEKMNDVKRQEEKSPDLSGPNSKQGSEDGFIVLQDEGDVQDTENWEKRCKEIEEEKSRLEEKICTLEANLAKIKLERDEIEDEFEKQTNVKDNEILTLKKGLKKYLKNIREQENEIKNLKKINESLKTQSDTQQKELGSATQKIDDDEKKVKISEDHDRQIEDLQRTIAELTREKQDLMKKVKSLLHKKSDTKSEHDIVELETHLNDLKSINENLKIEIDEQKLTISDLTDTIAKCEANASDVESKLMMENVDLQKKIIDMESTTNEKQTETVTIGAQYSFNYEQIQQIQNLLSTYFQITANLNDLEGLETAFKSIQNELTQIDVLEKSLKQLKDEISKLKSEKSAMEHEKKTLQADIVHYEEECEELMKNNEVLLNELENFKRNKLETISENGEESIMNLEKQLEDSNNLNRTLEEEYKQSNRRLEEIEFEKQELQLKLQSLHDVNENLERTTKNLKQQIAAIEEENCRLIFEINEMKTDDKKSAMESEIHEFRTSNQNLERQLERLSRDHADLVAAMSSQQTAFIEYKKETEVAVASFDRQLKEKDITLVAKDNDNLKLLNEVESLQSKIVQLTEQQNSLVQKLEDSENEIQKLTTENRIVKHKFETIQSELVDSEIKYEQMQLTRNVSDDSQKKFETKITELRRSVDSLTEKKNSLMEAITMSHNENAQYHNEIQRLDQLLTLERNKSQSTMNKDCENCQKLQNDISDLISSNKIEVEKLKDQINFLKEKSDILTTNLLTEQTNQKLLQQEKTELFEQNGNLQKDLERLRQHLVEMEESHTQETIEMQNIIDETKAKMTELQKEVANSSNAYTSASIRANQHAETLQAQYVLVSQQRDELAAKLSRAEDRESKNQAALVNLQCALEQFQKEKDKDILLATKRIRKELENERDKQKELQAEIASLNQQLTEANQGLLAAARLSTQLETNQMTIQLLKEQISKLESTNHTLDKKLLSNEVNQADKIEKSLVKSLIIGYIVSSNQNDKTQILKMISSILNFDQMEINKVGLNRNQSGWFSSLLQGGPSESNPSGDGLVKAFVEFLEKESQPRNSPPGMPNLLNIVSKDNSGISTATYSRNERKISADRMSTSSTTSTHSHHVQPILVNESVLEQFAPTRNSSSILKDILSDT